MPLPKWRVARICCIALAVACCTGAAYQRVSRTWVAPDFFSTRPLLLAARSLEYRYAQPVTYEDPLWEYTPEFGHYKDKWNEAFFPPMRWVRLSRTYMAKGVDRLTPQLVTDVVDAYNKQNGAPMFRVERSSYGLHIVPRDSRDSLLDAVIEVPEEPVSRSPVGDIAYALRQATGVRVEGSEGPGVVSLLSRSCLDDRAPQRRWKGGRRKAREVLISYLEHSFTTQTWTLECMPHPSPAKRVCYLRVEPLAVAVLDHNGCETRRGLLCDRDPNAMPAPPPLAPDPRYQCAPQVSPQGKR